MPRKGGSAYDEADLGCGRRSVGLLSGLRLLSSSTCTICALPDSSKDSSSKCDGSPGDSTSSMLLERNEEEELLDDLLKLNSGGEFGAVSMTLSDTSAAAILSSSTIVSSNAWYRLEFCRGERDLRMCSKCGKGGIASRKSVCGRVSE